MNSRRWVGLGIFVALVTLGGVAAVSTIGNAQWGVMAAWADAAARRWDARDFTREPVTGQGIAGSAFAAYAEAGALAEVLGQSDQVLLRDLRERQSSVSATDAADFARRWAEPLAALQRGAHLTDARPPMKWEGGYSQARALLLPMRHLAHAAMIEVRRRLARGEDGAAVDLSLDAATHAADVLHSPVVVDQMIGTAILVVVTADMWRDEDLRRLSADSLARLATGLAQLDVRCPTTVAWEGETLLWAHTLMHESTREPLVHDAALSLADWRHAWSVRWAGADAVLQQIAAQAQLAVSEETSWLGRQSHLRAAMVDPRVRANPMLQVTMVSWEAAERSLRSALTAVRLLRLAVAWHAQAPMLELADPLSDGPIEVARTPGGVTLRSRGSVGSRRLERTVVR